MGHDSRYEQSAVLEVVGRRTSERKRQLRRSAPGVSRQQASRLYDDLIGTFTRNGAVDEETQKNDLNIVRQVTNSNETLPNARAYDFSFALEADQQLNKTGWKP